MTRQALLHFLLVTFCFPCVSTQTTPAYLDKCIQDKELPASAKDNYVDCSKDEDAVANNQQDCCRIDNKVTCCNLWQSWLNVIFIITGILCSTIVLAIICFLVFWCDKDQCPRFFIFVEVIKGKCQQRRCCKSCHPDREEKEARRLQERHQREAKVQFEVPDDDFWEGMHA